MKNVRIALVGAIVVLEFVLWLVPSRVEAIDTELSPTTYGLACAAFSPDLSPNIGTAYNQPASPSYMSLEMRCNANVSASTSSGPKALIDSALGQIAAASTSTDICSGAACSAWVIAFGSGGSFSQTCNQTGNRVRLVGRGDIVNSAGTTIGLATNSSIPTNQFLLSLRCSDSGGWGAMTEWSIYWSTYDTVQVGTSNNCGLTGTRKVAVCFGADDQTDWTNGTNGVWPDYWADQGAPPTACDGADFAIREDGVTLAGSLEGVDADEAKTYTLRVFVPDTGPSDTWTVFLDADTSDAAAQQLLGRFTVPIASGIRDFNITPHLVALEDPTPELGLVRVMCQSAGAVGTLYWDGDTGLSLNFPEDPLPEPTEDDESFAGCFSFSGMSLTSPASWVRGIGEMGFCLVRVAFVPDSAFLDDLVSEVVSFAEESFPFSMGVLAVDMLDRFTQDMAEDAPDCLELFEGFPIPTGDTESVEVGCVPTDAAALTGTQRTIVSTIVAMLVMFLLVAISWSMLRA